MSIRSMALAAAALITLAACSGSESDPSPAPDPGAFLPLQPDDPTAQLWSPESRVALAYALPDQIGGTALHRSSRDMTDAQEDDYAHDPRVRQHLVKAGLSPSRVIVEQKSPAMVEVSGIGERIPKVGLAAVQIDGVPATDFMRWEPTFYLLLTSVEDADLNWQGEKPGKVEATIAGRPVMTADFERFKVAWYPYGDVLFIAVAANAQLLGESIAQLPWEAPGTEPA